ncbi:MAG: SpoIIE family protein phosphatase [Phycisphaerae bacterium]|nr:SpoIIE family protein phosphatase [Phycisphaerae bacterium]
MSQRSRSLSAGGRRRVARQSAGLALAGAFFTFAPIGFLMQLLGDQPGGIPSGLLGAAVSGLISIGWASSFMFSLRLLPLVILFQVFVPPAAFYYLGRWGWLDIGPELSSAHTRLGLCLLSAASMVIGYVLAIMFTRRIESVAARAQAELDLAGQIHRALVPTIRRCEHGLMIIGRSEASSEMGGDLIDVVVRADRVDVYLADVAGHGVKAGVVMGMVKSAVRMAERGSDDLAELVSAVNHVLEEITEPSMFVTFAALRFERAGPSGGWRVHHVVAGHPPLLLHRAASGEVEELGPTSMPLGVDPVERFTPGTVRSDIGDTFVLYTDGLTETADPGGHMFGVEALKAAVRVALRGRSTRPDAALEHVLSAVRAHGPQSDDRTLLLVRVEDNPAVA